MRKKQVICGVDEAGRGPLAGPVTAAAVVLGRKFPTDLLNDSKKLTPAKRAKIVEVIRNQALFINTGWAWPQEIDNLNIHVATLLAMSRALLGIPDEVTFVMVDGRFLPPLKIAGEAIIKGDSKIPEIMAASIVAKTARDKWMERFARIEPNYAFEKHKGYPTREHRSLIREWGLSSIHRKSFTVSFP